MLLTLSANAVGLGRRGLASIVPALMAMPVDLAGRTPDPIHAAIREACEAREEFARAAEALGDAPQDKARIRAADAAADRDSEARTALACLRPQTREGLHALIRFHKEDVTASEPQGLGAVALREIAAILPPAPTRRRPRRPPLLVRFALTAGDAIGLAIMCGGGAALASLVHMI